MEPNNNNINENNINPIPGQTPGFNPAEPVMQPVASEPMAQPMNSEPVAQPVASDSTTQLTASESMAQSMNPEPVAPATMSQSMAAPISTTPTPEQATASVSMDTQTDNTKVKKTNKTRLILIIVLAIVFVIAAVVTIIIVVNNSNNNNTNTGTSTSTEEIEETEEEVAIDEATMDAAIREYTDVSNELTNEIINNEVTDINVALGMYKEKIDSLDNKITQAMLTLDYLQMLMSTQVDDATKATILEDAVAADAVIRSSSSAAIVARIAANLGDNDLAEQYNQLANERTTEDEEVEYEATTEEEEVE